MLQSAIKHIRVNIGIGRLLTQPVNTLPVVRIREDSDSADGNFLRSEPVGDRDFQKTAVAADIPQRLNGNLSRAFSCR